jgi:tetratricopeptide (TPR) repeat protein
MDIKRTPLALFLAATITTGCNADSNGNNNSEYCRNGGSATDYTCDENAQKPDKELIDARALASTDEAWMQSKLAEIKAWLQQEQSENTSAPSATVKPSIPSGLAVRNPAATDPELMRIEAMSNQGNHRGAMSAVNSYMASHPDALEGLLTKSLVLSNMGQDKEAEALLKNTIARYPASPEAYNNLAVLYAGQNDYGRAIETLLQAFSTNPTYAQVHQNLRELYATVASQAYTRALDLNEQNANAPKLVMLRRTSNNNLPQINYQPAALDTNSNALALVDSNKVKEPVQQAVASVTVSQPTTTQTVTVTEPEVIQSQPIVIASKSEPKDNEPPKVVAAPQPPAASESPVQKEPEPTVPEHVLVKEAVTHVDRWASAWSGQNTEGYLSAYSSDFRPSNGLSHSAWAKQRKQRLTKPTFIEVKIENMRTRIINSTTANVTFKQLYKSNTYSDVTQKQLTLTRINNQWRITEERSL